MAILSTQRRSMAMLALAVAVPAVAAANIDISWYPPAASKLNNITQVLNGEGVYGFVYNTSKTPDSAYGTYNWCNMPHVRSQEYVKAPAGFDLKFVEVSHRHHKRTPYADNTFPVESYGWDCSDVALFYTGEPIVSEGGYTAAKAYLNHFQAAENHFSVTKKGFAGNCQFPQLTAEALDDSYIHGQDLYGVYHDLLGFLPSRSDANWQSKVQFRVTNNLITSQVAGMVINGMWQTNERVNTLVDPDGIDSLMPQSFCSAGESLFSKIKSSSNTPWASHLTQAKDLFATLDNISGVSPNDNGFHMSFDHYYDNLSARQCHAKPFPCKLVDGKNDTSTCVTQDIADAVYRMGNWEYSQIYRDASSSLAASASTYGTWIATLANHIRGVVNGTSDKIYFHNVAHDGSISRLLSVLQIDEMVWPGMGSEVVFELYEKSTVVAPSSTTATALPTANPACARDNCLRQMINKVQSAATFCPTFTAAASTSVPAWLNNCQDNASRVSSACSCLVAPATPSATLSATSSVVSSVTSSATASAVPTPAPGQGSESGFYVRVLFGGQVLKSSNPSLGLIDLIPVETLLGYFDGLTGKDASKVVGLCNGSIPLRK